MVLGTQWAVLTIGPTAVEMEALFPILPLRVVTWKPVPLSSSQWGWFTSAIALPRGTVLMARLAVKIYLADIFSLDSPSWVNHWKLNWFFCHANHKMAAPRHLNLWFSLGASGRPEVSRRTSGTSAEWVIRLEIGLLAFYCASIRTTALSYGFYI